MLALAGGVFGASLAFISVIGIRKFLPASIPEFDKITVNHTVLLFTILLTAITGLLFGSLPARRLSSTNLLDPLKSGAGPRREANELIFAAS